MDKPPTFFCDGMLGHVTRWLRLLGFDAEYAGNVLSDDEIVRRLRGGTRVLATRDVVLAQRALRHGVRVVRLSGGQVLQEVEELLRAVDAAVDETAWFRRCTQCNATLQAARAQDVADRVPPGVLETTTGFMRCPQCGHVYWQGTHVEEIKLRLGQLARRMSAPST